MEQTSTQLDEKLHREGYTPSPDNPNRYEAVNEYGGIDRIWTNGNYYQGQNESSDTWHELR